MTIIIPLSSPFIDLSLFFFKDLCINTFKIADLSTSKKIWGSLISFQRLMNSFFLSFSFCFLFFVVVVVVVVVVIFQSVENNIYLIYYWLRN